MRILYGAVNIDKKAEPSQNYDRDEMKFRKSLSIRQLPKFYSMSKVIRYLQNGKFHCKSIYYEFGYHLTNSNDLWKWLKQNCQ